MQSLWSDLVLKPDVRTWTNSNEAKTIPSRSGPENKTHSAEIFKG